MNSVSRLPLLVPEVVQTSAMDCGPASLKALLEGFGVNVSYGRLREACQTDVDGTSIDTLEVIARSLGLDAHQTMVPVDHLVLPGLEPVPAVVVARLADGNTHFVVAWRRHGPWLQIMDPAIGRRWVRCSEFLDNEVHVHEAVISSTTWLEWFTSEDSRAALRCRLASLGVRAESRELIDRAVAAETWHAIAALDASIRYAQTLVRSGAIGRGAEARRLVDSLYARALGEAPGETIAVPAIYWVARPAPPAADGDQQLLFKGAVLIRILGTIITADDAAGPPLSPELEAALREPPPRPGRDVLRLVRQGGVALPIALALALLVSAGGLVVESLLLRSLLGLGVDLAAGGQRLAAVGLFVLLAGALLLIDFWIALSARAIGRRFEGAFRIAFLEKLPRLADRYLHSRPISDMAERSHTIYEVRSLAALVGDLIRLAAQVCFITIALCWFDPASAPYAIGLVAISFIVPMVFLPGITELDLRVRNHLGGLSRFYLDALLGLVTIRAHSAERTVRREHEGLLVEWVRARFKLQRRTLTLEAIQSFVSLGIAAALILAYLSRVPQGSGVLLCAYWALLVPTLGQEIVVLIRQYPTQRNVVLRLLEPLGALDDAAHTPAQHEPRQAAPAAGVSISMDGLAMRATGHTILQDVTLDIAPSEHVCIVGASGAGKSSLVGLLLGWHRPAEGELLVDGEPLHGAALERNREHTAWLDPSVQLWNRSLFDNLRYGNPDVQAVGAVVDDAELANLLEALPQGLQSSLGEGGGLVSGGEGQRVRFGRALLRKTPRLVILDEPFRGLDRARRATLLARARQQFAPATLLCITHDIDEAQSFSRVLVLDGGRVVEDGDPIVLAAQPTSRFAALLEADRQVRDRLWASTSWRKLRLADGKLIEQEPPP
ncbi:MAG: ATP-binding cassette domain-containing protein [Kofleriaceae bacterium]